MFVQESFEIRWLSGRNALIDGSRTSRRFHLGQDALEPGRFQWAMARQDSAGCAKVGIAPPLASAEARDRARQRQRPLEGAGNWGIGALNCGNNVFPRPSRRASALPILAPSTTSPPHPGLSSPYTTSYISSLLPQGFVQQISLPHGFNPGQRKPRPPTLPPVNMPRSVAQSTCEPPSTVLSARLRREAIATTDRIQECLDSPSESRRAIASVVPKRTDSTRDTSRNHPLESKPPSMHLETQQDVDSPVHSTSSFSAAAICRC